MPLRWIETFGGPFIVLPYEQRAGWEGSDPPSSGRVVKSKNRADPTMPATDYDVACEAAGPPTFMGLVRRKDFNALALNREPLAVVPDPKGAVLVQWQSGNSKKSVEGLLRKTSLDQLRWSRTRVTLTAPSGKLFAFDAALRGQLPKSAPRQRFYAGRELVKSKAHVVALAPGAYAVDAYEFTPDSEVSLLLHRLRRSK